MLAQRLVVNIFIIVYAKYRKFKNVWLLQRVNMIIDTVGTESFKQ